MLKHLLILFIISSLSFTAFSQSATECLSNAQAAYNSGNYSSARNWIDKIPPPYSIKVKDLRNKIAVAEQKQRDRQKAIENEAEAKVDYNYHCLEAERYFELGDYKNAQNEIDEALKLGVSDKNKARFLKDKIETAWSNQFISNAQNAIKDNDFYKARDFYKEAQNIKYSSYISGELNKLSEKIIEHEYFVKQAETEFKKENYQICLDKLNAANDIIKLNKKSLDLKKTASMKLNIQIGDKFFNESNWKEASIAFGKAKEFAVSQSDIDYILNKINLSTFKMKIEEANSAYNKNDFQSAIKLFQEAQKYFPLEQNEIDLYNKAKIAYDDQVWNEIENKNDDNLYSDYINRFPNGRHVKEAEQKLVSSLLTNGDLLLKSHNYSLARDKYKKAQDMNPGNQEIIKKIKKVDRWEYALQTGLSVELSLPIGFNKTIIETDDFHGYLYGVSVPNPAPMPPTNSFVVDQGYGNQKIYSESIITPLQFNLEHTYTIRINGVQPMNINGSIKGVFNKGSNLNKFEPIDYSSYAVGDYYDTTLFQVTSVDTLSNYFTNAYKFSQFQFKIGIQPFSFIELYIPINRMSFQFQNDYNCLECATDDILIGKETKIGLGLKANYSYELLGKLFYFGGFYENWNKSFNTRTANNVLSDPDKKAGAGLFSFSPFSRSVGLNLGFNVSSNYRMYLNYTNNRVRGNFATTLDPLVSLRGFTQHIVSISFKYQIYAK